MWKYDILHFVTLKQSSTSSKMSAVFRKMWEFVRKHCFQWRLQIRSNVADIYYYVNMMGDIYCVTKNIEVMSMYCAICWFIDYCNRHTQLKPELLSLLHVTPYSFSNITQMLFNTERTFLQFFSTIFLFIWRKSFYLVWLK